MVRETVLNNILFNYNDSFDNLYNKLIENKDFYCDNIEIEKFKDIDFKLIIPIKYNLENDQPRPEIIIFKTLNSYYICYLEDVCGYNFYTFIIFKCSKEDLIKYFLNKYRLFDDIIVKEKKLLKLIISSEILYFPIYHTVHSNILKNEDNFKIDEYYNNFNYYYETISVSDSINKILIDLDLKFDYLDEKIIKIEIDECFINLDN